MEVAVSFPWVENPMCLDFDATGRLWVLEFVQKSSGPGAKIVVLSDTDGDGLVDAKTLQADGLDLPASMLVQGSGVYVRQPGRILWLEASNRIGGLNAGTQVLASTEEHSMNGNEDLADHRIFGGPFFSNIDNWIYSPAIGARFRANPGRPLTWVQERIIDPDWSALAADEFGRLIHAKRGGGFLAEQVPHQFLGRNPNHTPEPPGSTNTEDDRDGLRRLEASSSNSWIRASTGQLETPPLRSGTLVYTGDLLPSNYRDNLFTCDPRLGRIRRYLPTQSANQAERTFSESPEIFMDWKDQEFTPIQLKNGPDGALYVTDIGMDIDTLHQTTAFDARGENTRGTLEKQRTRGRILRIASVKGASPDRRGNSKQPGLWEAASRFNSPVGFWQDTAQRMFIEDRSMKSTQILEQWVMDHQRLVGNQDSTPPKMRLRALWTLEGQDRLREEVLRAALEDPEPTVRSAALQIVALQGPGPLRDASLSWIVRRWMGTPSRIHPSLLVCLGSAGTREADDIMRTILLGGPPSMLREDAAISALTGRELRFLEQLTQDARCGASPERHVRLMERLGRCLLNAGNPSDIERALDLAASLPETDWRIPAILGGLASPTKTKGMTNPPSTNISPRLPGDLPALIRLRRMGAPSIKERLKILESRYVEPTNR